MTHNATVQQTCVALMLGTLAYAGVASATTYSLLTTIPVPTAVGVNQQPAGAFTSFDISFFDPVTRRDYVADRSNASVDIFSGASLSFLGRATGFTGQQATTSVSGPDGVVAVTSGGITTLYAGDGNSTLKVINATNPAAPILLQSIPTNGAFRVDEMAYSPLTQQVLAANNADSPAFGNLFATSNGTAPIFLTHSPIIMPGAAPDDGLEQPVWDPNTGSFFISVPAFNGDAAGGVAEIRTDGTIGRLYRFGSLGIANCAPSGLALGASGDLMVGCSHTNTQTVLLNPAGNGSIVATFAQISGSDELWYDPALHDFFVTGVSGGGRVFDVISDSSFSLLQSVALGPLGISPSSNPHSISVDPVSGDVFLPLAGSTATAPNTLCPLGCIAVFAQSQSVPEPATLALLGIGVAGVAASRRRKLQ